jgi:hypothetical protein
MNQESWVAVFPNPVEDVLHIKFSGIAGKVRVRITDIWGKALLAREINVAETSGLTMDVSGLAPGLYLLNLVQGERHSVKKFIKN